MNDVYFVFFRKLRFGLRKNIKKDCKLPKFSNIYVCVFNFNEN